MKKKVNQGSKRYQYLLKKWGIGFVIAATGTVMLGCTPSILTHQVAAKTIVGLARDKLNKEMAMLNLVMVFNRLVRRLNQF